MRNQMRIRAIIGSLLLCSSLNASADTCYKREQTGTTQQCSTINVQECQNQPTQQCIATTRQQCDPWDHNVCSDVIQNQCGPVTREVCEPVDHQVCTTEEEKICKPVIMKQCKPVEVCQDIKPICQPGKPCPNTIIHKCETQQQCTNVTTQSCSEVPQQVCSIQHDKVCHSVTNEVCQDVRIQVCNLVHDVTCHEVPDQVCSTVNVPVCSMVPQQSCQSVPVFANVPYECGPNGGLNPVASSALIFINGAPLASASTYELAGHLLVPIRALFEALGATVDYVDADQSITARYRGHIVQMQVNSLVAMRDGQSVEIDVPPLNIQDHVYIPLRFAAESLNAQVNYVEASQSVFITTQ